MKSGSSSSSVTLLGFGLAGFAVAGFWPLLLCTGFVSLRVSAFVLGARSSTFSFRRSGKLVSPSAMVDSEGSNRQNAYSLSSRKDKVEESHIDGLSQWNAKLCQDLY